MGQMGADQFFSLSTHIASPPRVRIGKPTIGPDRTLVAVPVAIKDVDATRGANHTTAKDGITAGAVKSMV
ncbi:hypothetical protein A3Q32_14945 [Alcanivorax sp. KX64203]|nr:hypothetical protein A3Q32_14945 [Alcanivorax sp. KX64203]